MTAAHNVMSQLPVRSPRALERRRALTYHPANARMFPCKK
jgi:hypothetical protein